MFDSRTQQDEETLLLSLLCFFQLSSNSVKHFKKNKPGHLSITERLMAVVIEAQR